jgi:hypothetical protein
VGKPVKQIKRTEFKQHGRTMRMTRQANTFESEFTVFMLLKIAPEWLGFTLARARELAQEALAPILKKHNSKVSLRYFDAEFYSPRVTDIWIWRARDVHAYHHVLEDLRDNPFWNRYFKVIETLAGVEEAYARKYYRELIPTWPDSGFVEAKFRTMMQDVA